MQKMNTHMHACMHVHACTHTRTHMHARTHAHTHTVQTDRGDGHTHTHTVQTDRGDGQCCLAEIFWEDKCLEIAFEGRESSRECLMSWGRLFQMWGPKCEKVRKHINIDMFREAATVFYVWPPVPFCTWLLYHLDFIWITVISMLQGTSGYKGHHLQFC